MFTRGDASRSLYTYVIDPTDQNKMKKIQLIEADLFSFSKIFECLSKAMIEGNTESIEIVENPNNSTTSDIDVLEEANAEDINIDSQNIENMADNQLEQEEAFSYDVMDGTNEELYSRENTANLNNTLTNLNLNNKGNTKISDGTIDIPSFPTITL